jgi:cytochrome c peroxidase
LWPPDGGAATARDSFDIIAFRAGLTSPVLDATFDYRDATNVPRHFTGGNGGPGGLVSGMDNVPVTNPVTNAGAALGRVLFYDTRVSANDAQACGSCHVQSTGFADTARLSGGFAGGATGRHSMSLTNARYYGRGRMFWDERASTLEDQVLRPIQDPVEMGMTLDLLEKKLALTSYYPALFQAAFGTTAITRDRISLALAQFVRTLVSGSSKFDQGAVLGANGFATVFTAEEEQGRNLFASTGCARCHATFAQLGDDVHNTGLDNAITDAGAGNGRFKTPSLRNAGVRGRFMHDGRFSSLAEVVEFYDSGVRNNPGLDQRLRGPGGLPQRLNLSAAERAALVAFLNTLTDNQFLGDPRFANPFPR